MMEHNEENHNERWLRIAEHRVSKARERIRMLQTLSNTTNYDYSLTEVNELIAMLQEEVDAVRMTYLTALGLIQPTVKHEPTLAERVRDRYVQEVDNGGL